MHAKARVACNDAPGADEAMARARRLWEAGDGMGPLNEVMAALSAG